MNKVKIELNELNKLYDEIYYSNSENIEVALDVISNIISEKELEDEEDFIFGLSNIIDVIVEVLDEVSEVFYNEGLYDTSNYIKDKIDKIQSGKNDDVIENTYINYLIEDGEDDFNDDELYSIDEEYDADDQYEDEY